MAIKPTRVAPEREDSRFDYSLHLLVGFSFLMNSWSKAMNAKMNFDQDCSQMVVPFYNTSLTMIEYNGQPYVPMKPVVEGMGLAWQSQHEKLKSRFNSTVTEIMIVAQDGKQRLMTCLPLKKLFGWMMTISPNKVKPELKETIIKYQEECDDVLWNHWTGKLKAEKRAFDEFNKIEFDDNLSKAKATISSLGMHARKREKKINNQRRQDWLNKNVGILDLEG